MFHPDVADLLLIDSVSYRIAEHPAAPGMPYGQEGRAAVVYQVVAGNERRALKVFKPRFQAPALVSLADRLAGFADMQGLRVCKRTVLTARRHTELLRQYPDLTYAVLPAHLIKVSKLARMGDSLLETTTANTAILTQTVT